MNILKIEHLKKSFSERMLLDGIDLNISSGDKIGLIGVNGTGKSTLFRLIAQEGYLDSGTIIRHPAAVITYVPQDPHFDPEATVLQQVFKGDSEEMRLLNHYEDALEKLNDSPENTEYQKHFARLTEEITAKNIWEIESQAKTVLNKLGINRYDTPMNILSGGQQKRVALAGALIAQSDLLILDEPTNHMDNETIDWLEIYLVNFKGALLMITHDRYFLDRVTNRIIELTKGKLHSYEGNYSHFVEQRSDRLLKDTTIEHKRQNLLKKELAWIRAGVQGRGTKQKARIQRFEDLKEQIPNINSGNIDISLEQTRLGKKVIELQHMNKSYGEQCVLNDFSYIFQRDDRIGIIGRNGIGKSTLLNIITHRTKSDSGTIDIGSTVKIAHFNQTPENFDADLRAIDYVRDHAEQIKTTDGNWISAGQMMERFLFTSDMQYTLISALSGGEQRRLYLLGLLMDAPNVLLLDEPTNDLDIDTLKVLEDFIDYFNGAVVAVSHDRYFLDRIARTIFSFEEGGKIVVHAGNYSDYLERPKMPQVQESDTSSQEKATWRENRLKFTYKEIQEFKTLSSEISEMEDQLEKIVESMEIHAHDFEKLHVLNMEKDHLEEHLLSSMERHEHLSDLERRIEEQKK
jgi:ATP-binding cassette subfamily F protein uup